MGYYSHYTLMEITKIHILNKMAKKILQQKSDNANTVSPSRETKVVMMSSTLPKAIGDVVNAAKSDR